MTILIIRAEEGWIDCKWKVDCIWIVSALNQKSLVGFWGFLSFSQSKFIKKQKIYCELLSLASQLLPSWFSVARNNGATHCYASACEKDNHRCLTFKHSSRSRVTILPVRNNRVGSTSQSSLTSVTFLTMLQVEPEYIQKGDLRGFGYFKGISYWIHAWQNDWNPQPLSGS